MSGASMGRGEGGMMPAEEAAGAKGEGGKSRRGISQALGRGVGEAKAADLLL